MCTKERNHLEDQSYLIPHMHKENADERTLAGTGSVVLTPIKEQLPSLSIDLLLSKQKEEG